MCMFESLIGATGVSDDKRAFADRKLSSFAASCAALWVDGGASRKAAADLLLTC